MAAPKGFKKVETGLGGFWKPTKEGQHVQGIIGHAVETKGVDGKPNVFYTFRLLDEKSGPIVNANGKPLKTYEGMLIGIGGKTLLTFFADRLGKEVYIEYQGLGVAKRGQNAPKLYDTFESEVE
jgi:hypothetical protein